MVLIKSENEKLIESVDDWFYTPHQLKESISGGPKKCKRTGKGMV